MKKNKAVSEQSKPIRKWLILLTGIILALLLWYMLPGKKEKKEKVKPFEVSFTKQGSLGFYKKGDTVSFAQIDIEIAENNATRQQGLMYRHHISDSIGMLFIFEEEKPLSFWMKNTYVALDIIYVNSKKEIVSIHSNTIPLTENSLPSRLPALYVVEVAAGYCYRHKVETGDMIQFKRLK